MKQIPKNIYKLMINKFKNSLRDAFNKNIYVITLYSIIKDMFDEPLLP